MSDKTFIAKVDEPPPGGRHRLVRVEGVDVAVFNVQGNFYAIKNSCPHQGDPMSRGTLAGTTLSCPGHSWKFDIKSGRYLKGDEEMSLKTFVTTVEEGKVFVEA